MVVKVENMKRQDKSKTTTNLKSTFYVDKKAQDIMKEFYQKENFYNST